MFDLGAYLERIGLSGTPSLAEVHRAHSTSIPFENLDPQAGLAVSLEPEALQQKMVERRRGGYCFEQNMLLAYALQELGAEVQMLLGRARLGATPGVKRARSHLLLQVTEAGRTWHADVGYGLGTLLEPLPFGAGDEHEQEGWRYRIVRDGPELVLQRIDDGAWVDLYGFPPEPVPRVDVETINWWACTHPGSMFVSGLIVASLEADGLRRSLSDWRELELVERTPAATTRTALERHEIPAVLASRFALPGFTLDAAGRLVSES